MLSLVVVTVLLLVYNKAFDMLSAVTTQRGSVAPVLFGAVFSGFAATFGLLALCLNSTRYGLYGPGGEPLPASPRRLVGWVLYFAIEAYGSLSVSLFWQFVNSQVRRRRQGALFVVCTCHGHAMDMPRTCHAHAMHAPCTRHARPTRR